MLLEHSYRPKSCFVTVYLKSVVRANRRKFKHVSKQPTSEGKGGALLPFRAPQPRLVMGPSNAVGRSWPHGRVRRARCNCRWKTRQSMPAAGEREALAARLFKQCQNSKWREAGREGIREKLCFERLPWVVIVINSRMILVLQCMRPLTHPRPFCLWIMQ